MKPDLTAVIPIRDRAGGKTRLAERFSPERREALVRAMGGHVLDAVLGAGVTSQVLLVTRDPVFAQEVIGDRTGVRIVHQPSRFPGLSGALEIGRDAATSASTLVLFADLPLIQVNNVRAIASNPARIVLVPDRHKIGTNGVLIRNDADAEFRYQFGEASYSRHETEARRLGWIVDSVELAGTSTDLDTISDWEELPKRLRDELLRTGETDTHATSDAVASVHER